MFENETQVAWQAMPEHAPVVASDGTEIGKTEKLLGDVEDDIFHGVVIRRGDGEAIEIPAKRIKRMTERHVVTDLGADEAASLPPYRAR
ncbi:MAG TPA: hypothetical protein VGK28_08995 [Candidatus Dormibacteraeota bacterium]